MSDGALDQDVTMDPRTIAEVVSGVLSIHSTSTAAISQTRLKRKGKV